MIIRLPPRVVRNRGLSLLELTVVIAALLSLVSILAIGALAWKRGSDRAGCVLMLRNVQVATRSYQNLYGYNYGGHLRAENGTPDIAQQMLKKGYIKQRLFDLAHGIVKCPAGGTWACAIPDVFPQEGSLYLVCSLATSDGHAPTAHTDW